MSMTKRFSRVFPLTEEMSKDKLRCARGVAEENIVVDFECRVQRHRCAHQCSSVFISRCIHFYRGENEEKKVQGDEKMSVSSGEVLSRFPRVHGTNNDLDSLVQRQTT